MRPLLIDRTQLLLNGTALRGVKSASTNVPFNLYSSHGTSGAAFSRDITGKSYFSASFTKNLDTTDIQNIIQDMFLAEDAFARLDIIHDREEARTSGQIITNGVIDNLSFDFNTREFAELSWELSAPDFESVYNTSGVQPISDPNESPEFLHGLSFSIDYVTNPLFELMDGLTLSINLNKTIVRGLNYSTLRVWRGLPTVSFSFRITDSEQKMDYNSKDFSEQDFFFSIKDDSGTVVMRLEMEDCALTSLNKGLGEGGVPFYDLSFSYLGEKGVDFLTFS